MLQSLQDINVVSSLSKERLCVLFGEGENSPNVLTVSFQLRFASTPNLDFEMPLWKGKMHRLSSIF